MAGELATGYIQLIPSFRGAEATMRRELGAAASSAGASAGSSAGRSFNTSFGSALKSAAKGFGIVSLAAVAAGGAITAFGLKSAGSLEQTTVAYTSLLGSAEKANAEIKDLQKFAAKTPFSQSDVFGYAQQYFALADSVGLAKDQVKPFLSAIGDVAAVTGASTENIHNAVMAIGQIGSAGKVTLENLNQISEAFPGFNGGAAIAAATGQSTADVLKQISAGGLDAQTGIQALLVGMRKFPGAAGAMEKQSETLNGLFSTFTDTISIRLTKAFQQLVPVAKTALTDLTPVIGKTLDQLAPTITSFVKNLAPLLGPLIQGLGTVLGSVFDAFGPALKAIAPVVKPLANAFAALAHALTPLITLAGEIVGQLGPPLIGIFRVFLDVLKPIVHALSGALAPVLPLVADAFGQIAEAMRPVAKELGQAFADTLQAIAPQLPSLVKSLTELALVFVDMVQVTLPVTTLFNKLGSAVLPPLIAAFNGVADAVTWVYNHVLRPVLKGILDLFLTVVGGIVKAAADMFGWVPLVGDKLNHAADAIDGFRRTVDEQFTAINRSAVVTPRVDVKPALSQMQQLFDAYAEGVRIGLFAPGSIPQPDPGTATTADRAFIDAIRKRKPAAGIDLSNLGGGGAAAAGATLPAFDKSTLTSFLQQALGINVSPLIAAVNSVLKSAADSGKKLGDAFIARIRSENQRLIALTKQRDQIAETLQKATQEVASVRSTTRGTFDITTAGQNSFGEPVTFFDIKSSIRQALTNARKFVSVLKRLAREGLNRNLIAQLAEAGPGALDQARALLSATPKQLAGLNRQFRALGNVGRQVGNISASALFGAGKVTADGFIAGLRSRKSALTDAIRDLAKSMVAALRDALGIHSPSRVMAELGAFSGEGFAQGLASKYGAVVEEANRLANGALPRSQVQAWQAGGGAGTHVTYSPTINNPVPETATRSEARTNRALRNLLDA